MKLGKLEKRILVKAIYGAIDNYIIKAAHKRLSLPNIEKIFSKTEAFENLAKILVKEFEIEESEMKYVFWKVKELKKQFNPDFHRKMLEKYGKKTESSPETHI